MTLVPFDDRDGLIWLDGALVPWRDARLHVLSHGLHYASAVFEGERAYGGHIFRLRDHTERLLQSGRILGFDIPYSADEIDTACRQTLAASGLSDAYVRPVAWRGTEQLAVSAQQTKIHLSIAVWPWPSYFAADRMKGIRLGMADWQRPHPKTAPTASKASGLYMIGTMSKHKAEAEGYDDALMLDWRCRVAEATGANILFVREGEIHTPLVEGFLDGITRQTVMGFARLNGMNVIERAILPDELAGFSEVFLAGTAAEITPVREIAGHGYTPGRITEALLRGYAELVNSPPRQVLAAA